MLHLEQPLLRLEQGITKHIPTVVFRSFRFKTVVLFVSCLSVVCRFYKNIISILQILGNLQRFFVCRFCVNSDLIKLVCLLFVCCLFVRSKKIILLSYRKPIIYKGFLFVDFPIFDSTCVVQCVLWCALLCALLCVGRKIAPLQVLYI